MRDFAPAIDRNYIYRRQRRHLANRWIVGAILVASIAVVLAFKMAG